MTINRILLMGIQVDTTDPDFFDLGTDVTSKIDKRLKLLENALKQTTTFYNLQISPTCKKRASRISSVHRK